MILLTNQIISCVKLAKIICLKRHYKVTFYKLALSLLVFLRDNNTMYHNAHRGRGRGRGRGTRRPAPYAHVRTAPAFDGRFPSPVPEEKLSGTTPSEKTLARAKYDVRVANDWKTYYAKYFERGRYTPPRPSDTHRMPDADVINSKIDAILSTTVNQFAQAIEEHLQSCIAAAEDRVQNPPASKEELMWRSLTERFVSHYEKTMSSMMENLARTMIRIQSRDTERAAPTGASSVQQTATE